MLLRCHRPSSRLSHRPLPPATTVAFAFLIPFLVPGALFPPAGFVFAADAKRSALAADRSLAIGDVAPSPGLAVSLSGPRTAVDSTTVLDVWQAYFAALASMLAAGSALLAAIAVIRLQAFSTALAAIETATAETFRRVARLDDYVRETSEAFLGDRWSDYFDIVENLTAQAQASLAEDRDSQFIESKSYLTLLLTRGRKVDSNQRRLRSALKMGMLLTMAIAAFAVLALPAGRWASGQVLSAMWMVSGLLLFALFAFFARLTFSAMRNHDDSVKPTP